MKPSLGFIGLGLMGQPMVVNLLRAGFLVSVWNRTEAKTKRVEMAGAKTMASPADVAHNSDVLITMVSDPAALESVLWGHGVLAMLRAGSVLIDSSTISPVLARRIAEACRDRGAEFLDAPVTGGTWGAEKGELVFMVGGDAHTLYRVEPVLKAMGKRWFHLGGHGAGQTIKLAMNLILALEVQAMTEALVLVSSAGVPSERLLPVLQASMEHAPVLDIKGKMILERDFAPSFPLRLMRKDLVLALELAAETSQRLPAAVAARDTYSCVNDATSEDVDYASVARYWQKDFVGSQSANSR